MIDNKKITVVMPAYNAEKTIHKTVSEIPAVVDEIILVDDSSRDDTVKHAQELGLKVIRHDKNKGYGGNQKTCYNEALKSGSDIIVMVHPDYQYSPKLVHAMAAMIASGHYDLILASRILGDQLSRRNSMPYWRYVCNRALTLFQNIFLNYKLTEYHTGLRAFSKEFLTKNDYTLNSDDFVFDNEIIAQAVYFGYKIGEVSCPTRYTNESSSINFKRSVKYGIGVVITSFTYVLAKRKAYTHRIFRQ